MFVRSAETAHSDQARRSLQWSVRLLYARPNPPRGDFVTIDRSKETAIAASNRSGKFYTIGMRRDTGPVARYQLGCRSLSMAIVKPRLACRCSSFNWHCECPELHSAV